MDNAYALLQRLADGGVCSREALGVSERALDEALAQWASWGVVARRSATGDVVLDEPLELLSEPRIRALLPEGVTPRELSLLADTDSTNARLLARGEGVAPAALLAEHQSAGRGRAGRAWVSPFGCNLYLSLAWRFADGAAAARGLTLALGVAVVRALERLGVEGVGLKWPNDLQWDGCKLGGLLVEGRFVSGGALVAVMGLGLNLRMPPAAVCEVDQPWTELRALPGGAALGRNQVAAAMIGALYQGSEEFARRGLDPFRTDWQRYDRLAGRMVTASGPGGDLHGEALGIDDDGALLLRVGDTLHTVTVGDVSVRTTT